MATTSKTLKVQIDHQSSIPHAYWCTPVGWRPRNVIKGTKWRECGWWEPGESGESVAGLVWFGQHPGHPDDPNEDVIVEADIDDLRIAKCGSNCRVIGEVQL